MFCAERGRSAQELLAQSEYYDDAAGERVAKKNTPCAINVLHALRQVAEYEVCLCRRCVRAGESRLLISKTLGKIQCFFVFTTSYPSLRQPPPPSNNSTPSCLCKTIRTRC